MLLHKWPPFGNIALWDWTLAVVWGISGITTCNDALLSTEECNMMYGTQTMYDVAQKLEHVFSLEEDIIWDVMDDAITEAQTCWGNKYTGQHVFDNAYGLLTAQGYEPNDERL